MNNVLDLTPDDDPEAMNHHTHLYNIKELVLTTNTPLQVKVLFQKDYEQTFWKRKSTIAHYFHCVILKKH